METKEKTPRIMTRTDYVIANLVEIKSPVEFPVGEKIAMKRLGELQKIVDGISSKWFKNRSDQDMIDQTKAEMRRIEEALTPLRKKFKVI